MTPLTPIEAQALAIIRRWQDEYRNSPAVADLAAEIRRTNNAALNVLYRLELKGYIQIVRLGRRVMIVPLYWE